MLKAAAGDQRACLPARLPACPPARLSACLLSCGLLDGRQLSGHHALRMCLLRYLSR